MINNLENRIAKALQSPLYQKISDLAEECSIPTYLIGGYVRDIILERPIKDIDIMVLGSGIEMAELLAKRLGKSVKVTVYKNFGTAALRYKGLDIEFVGARKESYERHSRKPQVEIGSLQDDQNRRDFTINALAISLNKADFGTLIDPFGGIADMQAQLLRTPLNPDITFSDDPLRMMRAIRFAVQLGFTIDDEAMEAISRNASRLEIISRERIIDEINKMMLTQRPSIGFKLMDRCGILPLVFPELAAMKGVDEIDGKAHKDNFYHTLQVLDNICQTTDDLWLRWAALLHDIAKPPTKKFIEGQGWTFHGHEFLGAKMVPGIFKRLKLPQNEKMKFVQKMVLLHLRPIVLAEDIVTDSAIRRLLFDAGDDIDLLMKLAEADITSKNETKVARYLANFKLVREKLKEIEEKDAVRNFQPPVSGELIMETYGIPPSREVGLIKDAIKEAILEGEIHNDFQEAFEFMLRKADELGLKRIK
ncbi:MAG: CCA tRNA nucleotidyltransferase [Bacteroidales bacterium]|nr:CCA tRNA nucleotidyltransferase [Bacteroidales bacterium]